MAAPHPDLKRIKKAARIAALARRAGADPALGERLALHVLAEMPPPAGAVVAGYWPIGEEIDIRPLLVRLSERGHAIVLPETPRRGEALRFRRWAPGDALMRERFGTFAPRGEIMAPDWIIVPLLAFDRAGRRLGYGGGYYDRTLKELPMVPRLGAAFSIQEIPEVPAGPADIRLPAVATENGVIFCTDDG
jgi:5-formyltetrahydrofolate cyclo-ligase